MAWINKPSWQRVLIRLSNSYLVLFVVLLILSFIAIDWASHHLKDAPSTNFSSEDNRSEPHTVILDSMRVDHPWEFFHPTWKRESGQALVDFDAAGSAKVSALQIHNLVSDPHKRIEREFQISNSLKPRVMFWMEVYSRFSSRMRIIHDRNNLGIIYGYIDLRPLSRVLGTGILFEVKANEMERKIVKDLKSRLSEAVGLTKPTTLTLSERDEIQRFLSKIGALSSQETQRLINGMRSQTGQSDMFLSALFRSRDLLPHIESVFRRNGVPVALGRIPFVESSFNVRAHSKSGAVGIWQFTPETAREWIHADEEKQWSDPIKQTHSAARLLKLWRSVLPDWSTTVTSYNSGVGRLKRLTAKYRANRIEQILNVSEEQNGLGFAGQNFYAEVMAANLVEAYKDEIFGDLLQKPPSDLELVFHGNLPAPKEICDY